MPQNRLPPSPSLLLSPPPFPSTTPTSHTIIATIPSSPDIPGPSPRSRAPRRDTDPLFAELIPVRNAPWAPQAGVEPVGAAALQALLLFVLPLQGQQPTPSSPGILETSILQIQTLPKVKARVSP